MFHSAFLRARNHCSRVRAEGVKCIRVRSRRTARPPMPFFGIVAQLKHRTEHRETPPIRRHAAQHCEGCFHRIRAGVVTVGKNLIAVLLVDILPHAAGFIRNQSCRNLRGCLSQQQADGGSRKCIEYVMRTGNRKLCSKFSPTGQRRIRQPVVDHIKRAVLVQRGRQVARRVVDTIGHNAAAKFFPFVPQKRLVTAQNGAAVRL